MHMFAGSCGVRVLPEISAGFAESRSTSAPQAFDEESIIYPIPYVTTAGKMLVGFLDVEVSALRSTKLLEELRHGTARIVYAKSAVFRGNREKNSRS